MDTRDEVLAMFLDALGIVATDLRSFDGRKRMQKAIYLLQQGPFKRDFGFRYNLYIKGPYSPALANAGYTLLQNPGQWEQVRQHMTLKDDCKRDIEKVRAEFAQPSGSLDHEMLELAATAHFLMHDTFGYLSDPRQREDKARQWLETNKPALSAEFDQALSRLRHLEMV